MPDGLELERDPRGAPDIRGTQKHPRGGVDFSEFWVYAGVFFVAEPPSGPPRCGGLLVSAVEFFKKVGSIRLF